MADIQFQRQVDGLNTGGLYCNIVSVAQLGWWNRVMYTDSRFMEGL